MKKQQGQSMVEFALVAPILFLMIFGMIWGGFMFMEYLHFSNQVRTVARQIAVTDTSKRNNDLLATYIQNLKDLYDEHNMPTMYEPTVDIKYSDSTGKTGEVIVTVAFEMEKEVYKSLPNILKNSSDFAYGVGFPPKTIKTIEYHMKLEGNVTTDTNDDNNNNNNNNDNDDTSTTEQSTEG